MNERYLFRGKTLAKGNWIYGYYFYNEIYKTHHIFTLNVDNSVHNHEVDPETIRQCTGLKDKNGVLVFEGDIICLVHSLSHEFGIIEWCYFNEEDDTYPCGFIIKWNEETFLKNDLSFFAKDGEIEIIGNVHDNLELLENS